MDLKKLNELWDYYLETVVGPNEVEAEVSANEVKVTAGEQCTSEQCSTSGLLIREGTKVQVAMEWHLSCRLSPEFKKSFFQIRCRALEAVFGDLKGARGLVKNVRVNDLGQVQRDASGAPIVYAEKIVHLNRPKSCKVSMAFAWSNVDDAKWEELKEKFKEVFEPAALHGGVHCREEDDQVQISGQFKLAEKGGD